MNSIKILLLEDDRNLGILIKEHLEMQDYKVDLQINGEDGLSAYNNNEYDLCLVDIMMPKKDGFTFAREIRLQDQDISIIFLTAKSLKEDKIEGFKIGCDDYLTKPFSMEELLLRIQAVMRRCKGLKITDSNQVIFNIGDYTFNFKQQILSKKDIQHKLTPKESELLRLLCNHKNQTLERKKALREIWGNTSYFSGRSMDVFVSRLRKYFKDDSNIEIMGIHGKGLRFLIS
jgi:DNA-binding response OmpR family regulator